MRHVRQLSKPHYHDESLEDEGTWAISYGDMITLLLSFFVIFFTTDFKKEKVEKLNRHLSFELEGATPVEGKGGAKQKVEIPDLVGVQMQTHQVGENVVVTFKGMSFFNSGAVSVDRKGKLALESFTSKYLPYAGNYRIAIKGFTDARAVNKKRRRSKDFEDNLELSALRSISAMRVMQKAGIPLNRMEIAGAGELEAIDKVIPRKEGLTKKELEALSRTIVLVITPIKESWL